MNNFKLTRNNILGNIIEFESDGSVREIMYDVSDKIADIIEDLQKKAELADHYKHLYSLVKKQKDDAVEYIKKLIKRLEEFDILERKETGAFWYQVMGELKDLLRMLGEIE